MLARLGFPAVGRHRRFVTAVGIDALGSGLFIPVSILYFLAATDLSLVEVGAAVSLASLVALPAGPLVGTVVDRIGPKRVLLSANLMQAIGFLAYLVADSFVAVTAWTVLVSVGSTCFWGSFGTMAAATSAPGERERWFGFLGALRNVGFGVGGLLAGVVISLGTPSAYGAVVVVDAASYVVALVLLLAVPDVAHAAHVAARRSPEPDPSPGSWRTVLADRPYRVLWAVQLGFACCMLALTIAVPVYLTDVLGLPGWLTGVFYTLNCLMIGAGQGLVVRAMTGRLRWRILLSSQAAFAASFLVLLTLPALSRTAAVAVGLLAAVVFTVGELTGGPVLSALAAEAAPAHLRGRYLSLMQLSWNLAGVVAPLGFSWLLDRGATPVWLVLMGVLTASAVGARLLGRRMPLAAAPVTNRAEDPVAFGSAPA